MLCDNCLHKPVCGKFRATGGQVQKCDHLLEQKRGRWTQECKNRRRCSNCNMGRNTDTQLEWNHCPRCGAKMDLPRITDQTMAVLEKMGAQAHGEREITSE